MNRLIFAGLCAATTVAVGAAVAAQQLPDAPAKGFGTSITGAYEGWYDNPDGTHTFLVGYYNRNIKQAMDIPIGPNNHIDPGGPDMGQPTHFLPGRQTGVFSITVPKSFAQGSEAHVDDRRQRRADDDSAPDERGLQRQPVQRPRDRQHAAVVALVRGEGGSGVKGRSPSSPRRLPRPPRSRSGLVLPIWAEDDAKYSSGTNAPMTHAASTGQRFRGRSFAARRT